MLLKNKYYQTGLSSTDNLDIPIFAKHGRQADSCALEIDQFLSKAMR